MSGTAWWVFPVLVLCAVTFTAAAGVLVFLAARGVWRLVGAYRRSPRHAWRDPQEATPEEIRAAGEAVGRGYRAAWVPWETDPRFGSMQLADDQAWQPALPRDWREVAHEGDWRAQTAADLAPAALAPPWEGQDRTTDRAPSVEAPTQGGLDSGPGGPSLAPGPDLDIWPDIPVDKNGPDIEFPQVGSARPLDTEPGWTVAGRLVETRDEWLRRLVANAAPGWTYAGTVAA